MLVPELLPLPIEPELGDLVVLPDVLPLPIEPDEPDVEPDVPPLVLLDEPDGLLVLPLLELEPDLLKCASHSEREIWPSLFVSTDEKLGVEALLDELDGAAELPDDALSPAATARVERAKSAAAVVTVTVFSIW